MTLKNIISALAIISAIPLYGGDGGGLGRMWTLQQCIDHAIANNISVKKQQQTVEIEQIAVNTSRNSRLPGVNASASHSMNFGRGLTADNTYANRNTINTSFDMSANVMLYSGGQMSRDIEVKRLNLQAAIADLDNVKDNIHVQVISAYMEALYQHQLVEIAKQQLQLSRAQAERIRAFVDNGKRAEADYAEAEATIAADELTLTQNETNRQLAILTLSQLLELPSPEGFDIDTSLLQPSTANDPKAGINAIVLPSADSIYEQALLLRPQIQSGKYRLQGAERSIALARTGYLPTLSFGAGLSSGYYKTLTFDAPSFGKQMSDNFNKYVGLSLNIPVFNRFNTRNQIRQAKVNYVSQQLQLDETMKSLYKEIQQAYYNAYGAQRQCASSLTAEKAAQAAYDLMQGKYDNGKATSTELEEAKTRLIRSKCDKAQAECSFLFRHMLLLHYAEAAQHQY